MELLITIYMYICHIHNTGLNNPVLKHRGECPPSDDKKINMVTTSDIVLRKRERFRFL